ncbi:MAG: MerR family transcriptional regulator [Lentihominibacter sp.]
MKIGTFSRKANAPVSTIRYYISQELLTPRKNGAQYDFDEINLNEMQLLNELRQMNFTVDEMKRFINVTRMLDVRDELRYRQLLSILNEKRTNLENQRDSIRKTLEEIDIKVAQLKVEESVLVSQEVKSSHTVHGMPAELLSLIRCPECGEGINLENAFIQHGEIFAGKITCLCGYEGAIENGIINIDTGIDLDADPVFIDDYFGEPSQLDQDYCIQYEGFLSAKPDFLMVQHKAREWIHNRITESGINPRVILFPDIASLYLYLHNDAEYLRNRTIIVMGMSRKGIEASRRHLETLGADMKVMYVISPSNRLPLQEKSVDLMVDYLATFNYAFFYERQLYEYMDRYFSDSAVIAGATGNYSQGSISVKNIENSYTRSMKPFIALEGLLKLFQCYGYEIHSHEEIGRCTGLTDFFDYHVEGEAHEIHTYYAARHI